MFQHGLHGRWRLICLELLLGEAVLFEWLESVTFGPKAQCPPGSGRIRVSPQCSNACLKSQTRIPRIMGSCFASEAMALC
ncbi:uncharacterized protein SETTUDRAFT_169309 [Exserohilum turcica Et28A]|uniref:Secreted protein n=1 Tax=Exserohilum turcicum (strain 28A) TaxID=671987 RepID=R0IN45_EXST2|nr:uncharacterized protein SETTUDRAFT_169309 [Exserohilum turcica Et28A]EOA86196.1 hypothetical protein SETTUDRAFT_169309 [Exserohilum turcica Et28A]